MSQLEGDRDGSGSLGTKPLIAQVAKRSVRKPFASQRVTKFLDAVSQPSARKFRLQVAKSHLQQLVIRLAGEARRAGRSRVGGSSLVSSRIVHRDQSNKERKGRPYL